MSKSQGTAADRCAEKLETIATVLPLKRRDELAALLADQDVDTLRRLVNEGMGENTLRAMISDLAYLEAWSRAATGSPLLWPAPEALLLRFVAHHLWDPRQREMDSGHGMPHVVELGLRSAGYQNGSKPHAPATVQRRLASWSMLTKSRGLEGAFASPSVKSAIRLAIRATPQQRRRKSAKAITGDVLAKMLATCGNNSLCDLRDRAILMVAFASGGRRRSEIAAMRKEQLTAQQPIVDEHGTLLPSLSIHFGRTRTTNGDEDDVVYLTGRPVDALNAWLAASRIDSGILFRAVDRWGNVSHRALDPKSVNDIVKQRATMAGFEQAEYSAHGLRSGYLTEAAKRGVPLSEAIEQSRHHFVQQASNYDSNAARGSGRAARLLPW